MWGGQQEHQPTPRRLAGLSQIVAISAGGWYSLALKDDGTVWAWGSIANGDEDDKTMNEVIKKPVQIKGLANVVGIANGLWHALALKKDGTVWGWGRNYFGALGDGTETSRRVPVRAKGCRISLSHTRRIFRATELNAARSAAPPRKRGPGGLLVKNWVPTTIRPLRGRLRTPTLRVHYGDERVPGPGESRKGN